MQSEHTQQTSMTERVFAWLRGRWQLMTAPTPPYTGSTSEDETSAQRTKATR